MTVSTPLASPQVRDRRRTPQWLKQGLGPCGVCLAASSSSLCVPVFCAPKPALLAPPGRAVLPVFLPPGATLVAVFQTPLLPHIESVLQLLLCLLSETVHDPCLFLHLTSFCQIHLDLSLSQLLGRQCEISTYLWRLSPPTLPLPDSSAPMSSSPPLISCCSLIGTVLGPLSSWFSPLLFLKLQYSWITMLC